MANLTEFFDVIVVGAGLAGLHAAEKLLGQGKRVQVFEAKDRIGGRTFAAPIKGETQRVDWGAEWVIPEMHPRVMALIDRFGLTLEDENPDTYWKVPGYECDATYDELKTHRPGFGNAINAVKDWYDRGNDGTDEGTSLRKLLEGMVGDPIDAALVEAAFFPLTGADPNEVSARSIREEIRVHGHDIDQTLNPTTMRLTECTASLAEGLEKALPAGTVRSSVPVRSVHQTAQGIAVEGEGWTAIADEVLLAVPVAALGRIKIDKSLSIPEAATTDAMNAGKVTKLWATAKGKLRHARLQVGAPLRLTYIWDQGDTFFISAQALEKDLEGKDPASLFAQTFPDLEIGAVQSEAWTRDPYFGGSWMSPATGHYPAEVFGSLNGPVRAIGGDVAHEWVGWMEGALASAEAAVQAVE